MAVEYPNVECSHHSPAEPGYAVCLHVLQGVEVGFFELASDRSLGMILCAPCARLPMPKADDLSLCCVHCCREQGFNARSGVLKGME